MRRLMILAVLAGPSALTVLATGGCSTDVGPSPAELKAIGRGERYVACVRYNARGNDGKYDGVKTGMAIYVSGKLERFLDKPEETRSYCQNAKFAAFPELARLTR
jgi:hypothetical protein